MNKYTIDFMFNGLIDIEADTEKEAVKKYNKLSQCDVIDRSYNVIKEVGTIRKKENNNNKKNTRTLTTLKRFILGWLKYDKNDKEYKKENIEDLLYELEKYEL